MDVQGKSYGCSVASPYVGSDRCLLIVFANPVRAEKKLKAVASFSILGDFVRQTGGERVRSVLAGGAEWRCSCILADA